MTLIIDGWKMGLIAMGETAKHYGRLSNKCFNNIRVEGIPTNPFRSDLTDEGANERER